MPPPTHFAGWLPCGRTDLHEPHLWVYLDPATRIACDAHCDGVTRPEPETPCCADPLCPCHDAHPGWSTDHAGSMNYPDLTPTTNPPGSNGDTP